MRTRQKTNRYNPPDGREYALRRGFGVWEVTFETRAAIFKHEQGALYVACLLLDPPPEPLHAVALALKAKHMGGHADGDFVVIQQRNLGLDDAEAVRALWNRQRALERVMEDDEEIEPVKAEALRELEAITEFLRKNPWRSRGGAERCVRAVAIAIKRLHAHLAGAVDVEGQPHPVLHAFAEHLREHLLIPSGRGGGQGGARIGSVAAGCFTYEPPPGVVWCGHIRHPTSNIHHRVARREGLLLM